MTHTFADVLGAFSISSRQGTDGDPVFSQEITTAQTDHRGEVGLSAVAVIAESGGGRRFYNQAEPGTGTVQSRIHLTGANPVILGSRVTARATLLGLSNASGATFTEVVDNTGAVVCGALARGVVVSRPPAPIGDADAAIETPAVVGPPLLPPVDPGLTGAQVLAGLADGSIEKGHLQQLLRMTVSSVEPDAVTLAITPQPWTANQLGSIHGGVIAAMMTESCSLAVELVARPGQRFRINDIDINYFRSPEVTGDDLTVAIRLVKAGRRVVSVAAVMSDSAGAVHTRASADAM
jgi:uncharacterized protein (TIGR00369 family)